MRGTGALVAVTAMLAVLTSPVSASADTLPTAAVISPTSGSQVAGFVTVDLAGTATDVSDPAQRLQLYVDGDFKDEQPCVDVVNCIAAITWDTTGLVGTHLLQARLVTSGTSVLSAGSSIQVGDAPAATVTSPAEGASVRGKVTVDTAGTLDALQPDAVQSLHLLVDGTAVASSSCAAGVKVCLASLVWNSTGVQGSHQLQVRMTSVKGQSALSGPVNVLANNPVPTAVVSSPAATSTVYGKVNVVTVSTVDATQDDVGSTVQLLVDGSPLATMPCSAMSCPATFPWNTSGKAGIHTLQAVFTTAGGRTALSPLTSVWVLSTSTVTLDKPPVAASGASLVASGTVTSVDGSAIAGARVVVSVVNSMGKGNRKATVVTDSHGHFALPYTVVSNTTITAAAQGSTHYTAGSATTTATALPLTSCTAAARVSRGVADRVTCQLGATTRGTAITLQQLKGSNWQNLKSAKTTGSTWTWPQAFATRGNLQVRVVLGASRDFGAVTGKPHRISVR